MVEDKPFTCTLTYWAALTHRWLINRRLNSCSMASGRNWSEISEMTLISESQCHGVDNVTVLTMSQRTACTAHHGGEQGAAACQGDHRRSRGSANSSRRYPLHGQLGKRTAVSIAWNADTLWFLTVLKHQLNRIVVDARTEFHVHPFSWYGMVWGCGWLWDAVGCCVHMQQYSAIMCNYYHLCIYIYICG